MGGPPCIMQVGTAQPHPGHHGPRRLSLGIVLPGALGTCLGHIPPSSSWSPLLCTIISLFSLAVLRLHCIILHCGAQASLVVIHRLSSCSVQASLLRSMKGLSSPTRDRTQVPCIGRQILSHWSTIGRTRELSPVNKEVGRIQAA